MPYSDDPVWYKDLKGPRGKRYRVEITLAGQSKDDWMPDTPDLMELPDEAIEFTSVGQDGYPQGMAIGFQETGTRGVRINYAALRGTPALEDLRTRLLEFEKPYGSYMLLSAIEREFKTTNVWRIFSNRGIDGGPVNYLEFIGVQRVNPSSDGKIRIGYGYSEDYVLYDLARAIMEEVKMLDVGADAILHEPVSAPWGVSHDTAVDTAWISPHGRTYAMLHRGFSAKYYRLTRIFEAIQRLCHHVYRAFLRLPVISGWRFRLRGYREDASNYAATCWDHWTFLTQPYSDGSGDIENNPQRVLLRDEIAVQGLIAPTSSPSSHTSGLLLSWGSENLGKWPTVYDYLRRACEAAWCRGKVSHPDKDHIDVWFYRPLEGYSENDLIELGLEDLLFPRDSRPEVPLKRGGKAVRRISVEILGALGKDEKRAARGGGSNLDPEYAVPGMFNVNPAIGDQEWWKILILPIEGTSMLAGCGVFDRMYPWRLYYFEEFFGAVGGTKVMPHRCHIATYFDTGFGTTICSRNYLLPSPELSTTSSLSDWSNFFRDVRSAQAGLQSDAGMQQQVMNQVEFNFGSYDITTYELRVRTAIGNPENVGKLCQLPLGPGGVKTASGLLGTGETYLKYPGVGVIVGCTPATDDDAATIQVQGLL